MLVRIKISGSEFGALIFFVGQNFPSFLFFLNLGGGGGGERGAYSYCYEEVMKHLTH